MYSTQVGALGLQMEGGRVMCEDESDVKKKRLTDPSMLAGEELRGPNMSARRGTAERWNSV